MLVTLIWASLHLYVLWTVLVRVVGVFIPSETQLVDSPSFGKTQPVGMTAIIAGLDKSVSVSVGASDEYRRTLVFADTGVAGRDSTRQLLQRAAGGDIMSIQTIQFDPFGMAFLGSDQQAPQTNCISWKTLVRFGFNMHELDRLFGTKIPFSRIDEGWNCQSYFRPVFVDFSANRTSIGFTDPTTNQSIPFGYVVMICGAVSDHGKDLVVSGSCMLWYLVQDDYDKILNGTYWRDPPPPPPPPPTPPSDPPSPEVPSDPVTTDPDDPTETSVNFVPILIALFAAVCWVCCVCCFVAGIFLLATYLWGVNAVRSI